VLVFLWSEDGLSQAELSRRVAIEEATMVRTLDRMERDGLVRRERDARDRRRMRIRLTERGGALRDVLVPLARGGNEKAVVGLTEAERRQFADLLRRVTAALEGSPPGGAGRPEQPSRPANQHEEELPCRSSSPRWTRA
jgi:DNA-binding MarR family transcriptional regulator